MTAQTGGRAEKLVALAASHADEGTREVLDGALGREQLREVMRLLQDALYELFNDTPNEKRMHRKLRDACLVFLNLDMAAQVDDDLQARAVKLVQENIIKKNEKERLANELADLGMTHWRTLSEDDVEAIVDEDDGLIAAAIACTQGSLDPGDKKLAGALIGICRRLALPFLAAFEEQALDQLIAGAAEVCTLAASGGKAADALQKTVTLGLEQAGIIRAMRKSFAGLLVGDIILRQVGKGLGIKEKISVTDFIIFLACQVADRQFLPDVDKAELLTVKAELEAL